MVVTRSPFKAVVIDTNFFISLLEAGTSEVLPQLKGILGSVGTECAVPAEIPRTDIPGMFRELRHLIPEYMPLIEVSRSSQLWKKTAEAARKNRMIRYDKDPADIDVVVLSKMLLDQGKHPVAVVSDDAGVGRAVTQLRDFQGVQHLSCGSFLSVLAAMVGKATKKDIKLRRTLDKAVRNVFRQSWTYKKKTRSYIDIKMLVEDLTDTARFVRSAAESSLEILSEPTPKDEVVEEEAPPLTLETKAFDSLLPVINECREARDSNRIGDAEIAAKKLVRVSTGVIPYIPSLEEQIVVQKLARSEMIEHHTWLLHTRIRRNEIVEALVHSQACLTYMGFLSVGKEVIENTLSLQGLLYLLLGRNETALEIFESISIEDNEEEMSSTQLMGLVTSFVASNEFKEATSLVKRFPDRKEGLFDSLLSYANDAFTRDRVELATSLFQFLVLAYKDDFEDVRDAAERLFIVSRLNPTILSSSFLKKTLKGILGSLKDDSKKAIPKEWLSTSPIPIRTKKNDLGSLWGTYHVLQRRIIPSKNLLEIIAWGIKSQSLWKVVLPSEYFPALQTAITFRFRSGEIEKILPRGSQDPEFVRGTLNASDIVVQVDMASSYHAIGLRIM